MEDKMKKLLALIVSAVMLLGLVACAAKDTTIPEIAGVSDTASVSVGSVFDALSGVTATDDTDGDITSKIVVTAVPELTFTDGKTTPTAQGNYELTYSVKDAAGNEANAYCTLTVTRAVTAETLYKSYELGDTDYTNVDDFGLELKTSGEGQATLAMAEGNLRLNVTNSGASAGDIKIVKETLATVADVEYEIVFYMKSSAPIVFNLIANNNTGSTEGESIVSSSKDIGLGNEVIAQSLKFNAPAGENQNVQLILEMGKHSANEISNPTNYVVDIVKIEYVEKAGVDVETSLYDADFSAPSDTLRVANPEMAEISYSGGNAVVNIKSYADATWENKIEQDTDVTISPEKKYRIKITMSATNAQSGDFCIEDKTKEHAQRALWTPISLEGGGKEFTLVHTFMPEYKAGEIINPSIKYYIGKASDAVTSNVITISKMELLEVTGDKVEDRTNYRFIPYNKETEWDCFNGSDAKLPGGGVGSMYESGGKMFYRIDQISDVDYGNKVFINKIRLEKNALYKVKFTIKGNKPGTCWFILNKCQTFDPRINSTIQFNTEEQTVELTTTQEFALDMDFELVFTFGKGYNTENNLLIEISNVSIYKIT